MTRTEAPKLLGGRLDLNFARTTPELFVEVIARSDQAIGWRRRDVNREFAVQLVLGDALGCDVLNHARRIRIIWTDLFPSHLAPDISLVK